MHTYIQMSEGVDRGSPDGLAPKTSKTDDQCGGSSNAGPVGREALVCVYTYEYTHAQTRTFTRVRIHACMHTCVHAHRSSDGAVIAQSAQAERGQ